MKVKILKGIASPSWSYSAGDVVDIKKDEALRWVKAGIAENATKPAGSQKAVKQPSSTATKPVVKENRKK